MSGAVLLMATSGGMSVKLAPTSVNGFGLGTVTTTNAIVGTITGGLAPYVSSWTSFDPDIFPVTPSQPTSFFRRFDVEPGGSYSATVRLTVTDAVGQSAFADGTANITGL